VSDEIIDNSVKIYFMITKQVTTHILLLIINNTIISCTYYEWKNDVISKKKTKISRRYTSPLYYP